LAENRGRSYKSIATQMTGPGLESVSLTVSLPPEQATALKNMDKRSNKVAAYLSETWDAFRASADKPKPARKARLSRILDREMRARGWNIVRLAEEAGLAQATVFALVEERVLIDEKIAQALARGFGTSEKFWLALDWLQASES
jgi:plasmid maintenance system antidote protein VapI